ncbi:MAG: DUF3696 domain-containing protein [Chloroflexi bacterium]|nr:DUF3696 domain-containing protein [Chloroflexota bacterium]
MFKQISMTNFKSWRETGPVRMAPLTGFFGANSSGKSSLLQMLLLLKQTTESNDPNLVLKTGSLQPAGTIQQAYVNLGAPHEITHRNTTEMTLTMRIQAHQPLDSFAQLIHKQYFDFSDMSFETTIHADSDTVYVDSLRYFDRDAFSARLSRQEKGRYNLYATRNGDEFTRPRGRPKVDIRPTRCYGFSHGVYQVYNEAFVLQFLEHMLEKQFSDVFYLGPLREFPQREYRWGGEQPSHVGIKGELAIPAILASGDKKVYSSRRKSKKNRLDSRVALSLVELNLASSFRVEPVTDGSTLYQVKFKRNRRSHEVLITDMGIGVSQVLPVLVLCYNVPEGSTIILEQPELHLHPSVQAGLADVFIDVIKNRNLQILLESHSEHLLRRLQRRIAEEDFAPEDVALYFCEMTNGESELTPLEIDMFGNIANWPDDFFGDLAGDMVAAFDAGLERQVN